MSITSDRYIVNFCHCTHLLQVNSEVCSLLVMQKYEYLTLSRKAYKLFEIFVAVVVLLTKTLCDV